MIRQNVENNTALARRQVEKRIDQAVRKAHDSLLAEAIRRINLEIELLQSLASSAQSSFDVIMNDPAENDAMSYENVVRSVRDEHLEDWRAKWFEEPNPVSQTLQRHGAIFDDVALCQGIAKRFFERMSRL